MDILFVCATSATWCVEVSVETFVGYYDYGGSARGIESNGKQMSGPWAEGPRMFMFSSAQWPGRARRAHRPYCCQYLYLYLALRLDKIAPSGGVSGDLPAHHVQ